MYFQSNDVSLLQFAIAHNLPFQTMSGASHIESILDHLLNGKCFSTARPGHACRLSRTTFENVQQLIEEVTRTVLRTAKEKTYLLTICNALGMTQTELRAVADIDDCKKYITLWSTNFAACHNIEDVLIRCEDMSDSELLVTCRTHNITTENNSKSNISKMRSRLLSHLCQQQATESTTDHDLNSDSSLCCTSSPDDVAYLIQKVLTDLCDRPKVKLALRRILITLGVAIANNENLPLIRKKAKEYLRKVKHLKSPRTNSSSRSRTSRHNGKTYQVDILQKIKENWPQLATPSLKGKLLSKCRVLTSSLMTRRLPCAVCAEGKTTEEFPSDLKLFSEIDLQTLRKPYPGTMPNPFQGNRILQEYILCPEGVIECESNDPRLRICKKCLHALQSSKKIPQFALANDLLIGDIPKCLEELNLVEESCVGLRKGKCCIIHLNGDSNVLKSPISQRGLRGHVIIYPKKLGCMANVLPPPMDDVVTPICVVFVGSSPPTKEWLLKSAKPLVIRREKVRNALVWLKENNPLYKDVCIDHELLDTYEHEFVAPVHIIVRDAEEDDNAYGATNGASEIRSTLPEGLELAFDSAIVTDLQGKEVTPQQMTMSALQHLKSGGGFLQIPHESEPTNTYEDYDAFPAMFPTLFPYGVFGFERPEQPHKLNMKLHARHLLSLSDRRFQEHSTFQFMVYNILQRREVNKSARFKISKRHFDSFARDLDRISTATIDAMAKRIEGGALLQAESQEEQTIVNLMERVKKINSTVPGTSASKVQLRNKIRAMMMQLGMPSFYITINPADIYNPILKCMSGEEIDVDNLLPDQIPTFFDQAKLVAKNPVLASQFFHLTMTSFFDGILNYTHDNDPTELGLFGLTKGYFGCVEAQGRGTLHCHLFVWLEGALNPEEIKQRVQDKEFTDRLCAYIDDCVLTEIPPMPSEPISYPNANAHPCATRGAPVTDTESFFESSAARHDLHRLANACQKHVHSATCYKHWKGPHEQKECRFNLDPSHHVDKTTIDSETGELEFRVTDGMVNNFCETILLAMRCNIDIKFIGSGQSAKAVLYYITDYITKSQLKAHTAYSALKTAVLKLRSEQNETDPEDYAYKAKQLLIKCANSLISKQELSAPQVSSYLMGYGDHYTSHSFHFLHLPSFQAFVNDQMQKQSTDSCEEVSRTNHVPTSFESTDSNNEEQQTSAEEPQDNDDEEDSLEPSYDDVVIGSSGNGHVKAIQNDVTDYTMRSLDDENTDLWSFISMYDKQTMKNDRTKSDNSTSKGRPCNRRSNFLPSHPEASTHILRQHCPENFYVPVPTCAIPNSAIDAKKEKHAQSMLLLFKPWRSAHDLLEECETWFEAYNVFLQSISADKFRIIKNMQLLHECKDARDKDFANRSSKRRRLIRSLDINKGERIAIDGSLDDFLGEDDQVVDRLQDMKKAENKRRLKELKEQEEAVEAARANGLYSNPYSDFMDICDEYRPQSIESVHRLVTDEGQQESIWREAYEKRRSAHKQNLKGQQARATQRTPEHVSSVRRAENFSSLPMSISSIDLAPSRRTNQSEKTPVSANDHSEDKLKIVNDISLSFTLNEEQDRAFRTVAMHAISNRPCCPLNLFIHGPGGTGKSRVIDALKALFSAIGQDRRFRLSSYTGVAAKNIQGMTLHCLLNLSQIGKENKNTSKSEAELFEMWTGVEYLFIDEVSMIGSELLADISAALSIAKANAEPFGGISVIYAGDFCQLPPVADTRLYTPFENKTTPYASLNKLSQKRLLGRSAWLSCDSVVELHQQMRQQGTKNARFRQLLDRLRMGKCNYEDIELLQSRVLEIAQENLGTPQWQTAPIITKSNHVKDALNDNGAQAFADRHGKELHYYHATDFRSKRQVTKQLQEELYTFHSCKTKQALGRLPLVEGMPVIFTQNYDVAGGIVNGSTGILKSVRYTEDENGFRYAESCVVEVSDINCEPMPGLHSKEVVALAELTEFKIKDFRTDEKATFTRKQLPIQPAFAMTDYKSQGRTLKYAIVDLTACTGSQSPYVMVSRVTSLDGLLVLRAFNKEKVCSNPSQDLRIEVKRIKSLHANTERLFADDLHFCRADPSHKVQSELLKNLAPESMRPKPKPSTGGSSAHCAPTQPTVPACTRTGAPTFNSRVPPPMPIPIVSVFR